MNGGDVSPDDARPPRGSSQHANADPDGHAGDDRESEPEVGSAELSELRFADLIHARQASQLPTPRAGVSVLPLSELDPEMLERLAAEMVKRRPNLGAHFYGRRGQKQHGLDIVERETGGTNSVYQVRRYQVLTPDEITSAVSEYADPKPLKEGGEKPPRRFDARRYVLFTSAAFETDTALQERLEELQAQYADDLIIAVWGQEMISGMLRDSGALVNSVFGPEWAREFCGFAPPPPGPADPDPLGLVESPIEVLNLDAIASDARTRENDDPLGSARLYGILADTLAEANFPGHAAAQRRRQAQLLQAGGDSSGAFTVLWDLARADFTAGATSMLGPLQHGLEVLRAGLDEHQTAKLDILTAAQGWYERGSQLALPVPALETVKGATDPDAAFLACIILEQALVDGWFDLDPPHSLVDPGGNNADLLARLRRCADGLSSGDVVIRARLACALADASLTANSTAADTNIAFAPLLSKAGAGRYLRAGGLIHARAAHALAMHGDTTRAIDLWRQAILLSSESRLYGDVAGCRRALNAAILEQPAPTFAQLGPVGPLPNADRLLATDQSAELYALRAAHAGKLPDAFSVTRRHWWEARLSGHLIDEREALELFGDVLLAAKRPDVAVTAWIMAGAAAKAAKVAGSFTAPLEVEPWARSPARARQAAAAQVIGAQARLYGAAAADKPAHLLLDLTTGLWAELRIQPHPALDAVNALSRFGRDLPASAVDPVLELVKPRLAAGGALLPEMVELLIQLYWAVPRRREDLAAVIGPQLALDNPPPGLWEMVGNLPEQARGPVTPAVSALADAGNIEALRTLANWGQSTAAVQLAARRTCAHLLRQPTNEPSNVWSLTTQFSDAVALLGALANADPLVDVEPRDLQPGAGPMVSEKTVLSMRVSVGAPPAVAGSASPSPEQGQAEVTPPEQASAMAESAGPSACEAAAGEGSAAQPDPQAVIAAGPPSDLAAAVAEHLLAVAESHHPPAFFRAESLSALYSLLGQLAPNVNSGLTGRVLAIAENPGLNLYDQAELDSQDSLSRGQLDLGARSLPALALITAASAAGLAADAGADVESLRGQLTQNMVTQAVQLLHGQDHQDSKNGAIVLAMVSRVDPALAHYADALIVHPSAEIRAVAASVAVLDAPAQRILAADSSPQVRASLASRRGKLADDVLAALQADEHPEVKRALATDTGSDSGESE